MICNSGWVVHAASLIAAAAAIQFNFLLERISFLYGRYKREIKRGAHILADVRQAVRCCMPCGSRRNSSRAHRGSHDLAVCGKRALFRGSELQLRHKGLALNALQRLRTFFTAFFRSLLGAWHAIPGNRSWHPLSVGVRFAIHKLQDATYESQTMHFYSTIRKSRNARNSQKTNDRCTFYSTINRDVSEPNFSPKMQRKAPVDLWLSCSCALASLLPVPNLHVISIRQSRRIETSVTRRKQTIGVRSIRQKIGGGAERNFAPLPCLGPSDLVSLQSSLEATTMNRLMKSVLYKGTFSSPAHLAGLSCLWGD